MIDVLLNGLWQGAFVVAVAAGVTAFVPRRHAATRYTVWFAALAALAILPLSGVFSFADPASAIPSSVIRTTTVASHATLQAANAAGWWLAGLWVAGLIVCVTRLVLSYIRIKAIARSAVDAPHLGEGVRISSAIAIPIATGFVRPSIILPEHVVDRLDAADLASIVAHERAHIQRNDILGNLIQRLLEAALFFNPWVYVIGRRLVEEREAACDDWAVRLASNPERYASCLVGLAQRTAPAAIPLLTPSAIGSGRILVGRITRLLNGKAGQVKPNYVVLSAAIALFAVLGFAFQSSSTLASTGKIAARNGSLVSQQCSADASVLNPVAPHLSESFAKAHPNGHANVLVTVAADGTASNVKVVNASAPEIAKAALEAAAHSTYEPELRNCKPVAGGPYLFHVEVGP
jgi:beta-lactamase regulating signal transducer with metallopeptidase domain